MKALHYKEYGGPEILSYQEMEQPEMAMDELLIRVKATTVSRTDCGILTGLPKVFRLFVGWPKPKRKITGSDFAGEVINKGAAVKDFEIGDRVFGFNDEGYSTHAEYITLKEKDKLLKMPENISFEEAAALCEGPHYAYNFVNKVKLKKGDEILVYGCTGAIGSAAMQILKALEMNVTVVGPGKEMERIQSFGMDKVLDYQTTNYWELDQKYDYVLDAVGKSRFKYAKKVLKKNGVYISSELGPGSENIYLSILGLFKTGRKVKFPIPLNIKRSLIAIKKLYEEKKYRPMMDRTFPLSEGAKAFEYVMKGQKLGNVVLKV